MERLSKLSEKSRGKFFIPSDERRCLDSTSLVTNVCSEITGSVLLFSPGLQPSFAKLSDSKDFRSFPSKWHLLLKTCKHWGHLKTDKPLRLERNGYLKVNFSRIIESLPMFWNHIPVTGMEEPHEATEGMCLCDSLLHLRDLLKCPCWCHSLQATPSQWRSTVKVQDLGHSVLRWAPHWSG